MYMFFSSIILFIVLFNYFGIGLFARINAAFTAWKILIPVTIPKAPFNIQPIEKGSQIPDIVIDGGIADLLAVIPAPLRMVILL